MTTLATPDEPLVRQVTVAELFQHHYLIPAHQRPYSWTIRQIEQLLEDLSDHRSNCRPGTGEYYHLHGVTWSVRADGTRIVSDGQQRITTLYLFHAAVLCLLARGTEESFEVPVGAIKPRLAADSTEGARSYKLTDQFTRSNQELKAVIDAALKGQVTTVKGPYAEGFRVILAWLEERFASAPEGGDATGWDPERETLEFFRFVEKKALLGAFTVAGEEEGWKAFERANNRGLGVAEADRVKNRLFGKARAKRAGMISSWNSMCATLRDADRDIDEFLRLYLTATYASPQLRDVKKGKVFMQFADGGVADKEVTKDAAKVAADLDTAATAYQRIHSELRPFDGQPSPGLTNLRDVFGRIPPQLLPLLLAGRGLQPAAWEEYVQHLLVAWLLHTASGALPSVFAPKRASWLPKVRKLPTTTTSLPADFVNVMSTDRATYKDSFAAWILNYTLADAAGEQKKPAERIARFLLGVVEDRLRAEQSGTPADRAVSTRYINRQGRALSVTIEHILPVEYDDLDVEEAFGDEDTVRAFVQRLGNLSLLTVPENGQAGNKDFTSKVSVYAKSAFRLSNALDQRVGSGPCGQLLGQPPLQWTSTAVVDRQERLYRALCLVLQVPEVSDVSAVPALAPREDKLGYKLVQSDSADVLLSVANFIATGGSSREQIGDHLWNVFQIGETQEARKRQAGYYVNSLRVLNLVELDGDRRARLLVDDVDEQVLAEHILSHPASGVIGEKGYDHFRAMVAGLSALAVSTQDRRCQSHGTLYDWAQERHRG